MLLKHLVVLLVTVGVGIWVSAWLTGLGLTLPAYIGAMLVAAVFRNLDDLTGVFRLSQRLIDDIGTVALSLFLVMALMTLRLWELAGLVTPLLVILAALVERYGPAPKAYLVVPLGGAFFIDFANALLITFFLNFWN